MTLKSLHKPLKDRHFTTLATVLAVLTFLTLALVPVAARNQAGAEGVATAQAASQDSAVSVPTTPGAAPVLMASADMLGLSGRLRAVMGTRTDLEQNPLLKPLLPTGEVTRWPKLSTPDGDSLTVVTLVPMKDAASEGYGRYHVGSWPQDGLTSTERYTPPSGFIGVTPENEETNVSANFKMRDFLTHDQGDVWPKVLVLQPRLLDKLELLRAELEREGLPNKLHVMSGFRTPQYNEKGVGKGGRATHSRHTYGDAADVFVDADGDGMMDDLNADGKVTVADAKVLREAAERVEAKFPSLVGGLSAYPSNGVHGPFVHVDARGVKARW